MPENSPEYMSKEQKSSNNRRHPRIAWNFMVRLRERDKLDASWELTTIKNISEGGCFFYSNRSYELNQLLEIEVQIPVLPEPMKFIGRVKRSVEIAGMKPYTCGVGVEFVDMEQKKRDSFIKTIAFFLKKYKGQQG